MTLISCAGITQRLLPCCKGLTISDNCGDVDTEGTPLYTLCTSPEQHTFWDVAHPTQSTWKAVMHLYISSNASFVQGAPNLLLWLRSNALGTAPTASPTPTENRTGESFPACISICKNQEQCCILTTSMRKTSIWCIDGEYLVVKHQTRYHMQT